MIVSKLRVFLKACLAEKARLFVLVLAGTAAFGLVGFSQQHDAGTSSHAPPDAVQPPATPAPSQNPAQDATPQQAAPEQPAPTPASVSSRARTTAAVSAACRVGDEQAGSTAESGVAEQARSQRHYRGSTEADAGGQGLFSARRLPGRFVSFNEFGRLNGHAPFGSYTLCSVRIDKVHLSKHKVELVGGAVRAAFSGSAAL